MKGHLLEVELLSLDSQNYERTQDFFTKHNDLLLQLKDCGIEKSKEESHQVLSIMSNLRPEYSIFVSTFYLVRLATGKSYTIPSLKEFIKSLTFEHDKLIGMGKIKPPKVHALSMHDGSHNKNHRSDSN